METCIFCRQHIIRLWLLYYLHNYEVMTLTRKDIRDKVKLYFGLSPESEDGNLTNAILNNAVYDAVCQLARDCKLVPDVRRMVMEASKWQYPMDDNVDTIRSIYYIDSNGQRVPLDYISLESFYDNHDPTETSDQPSYFTYPIMQPKVYQWHSAAPPNKDYISKSYITENTVRTLVDSGANYGNTLDGTTIEPDDVVYNLSDDSYGYIEVLDISTAKTSGTATTGTVTTKLYDTSKNFTNLDVQVGDIVCKPSTGTVTSYARITEVGTTYVKYDTVHGAASYFSVSDTYKIGRSTEIRLKGVAPHPGLREGSNNYFSFASSVASITGTTFTNTRCTGTITGTPVAGYIALASTGQHGTISLVASTYVNVDYWIGGKPSDGAAITVHDADQYQIETKAKIQKAIWLLPTPDASDTEGTESLEIIYVARPIEPQDDTDILEIPDKYEEPLRRCAEWQAAMVSGTFSLTELDNFEAKYRRTVASYKGDIYRPPIGKQQSVFTNRSSGQRERKYTTKSGYTWRPLDE